MHALAICPSADLAKVVRCAPVAYVVCTRPGQIVLPSTPHGEAVVDQMAVAD